MTTSIYRDTKLQKITKFAIMHFGFGKNNKKILFRHKTKSANTSISEIFGEHPKDHKLAKLCLIRPGHSTYVAGDHAYFYMFNFSNLHKLLVQNKLIKDDVVYIDYSELNPKWHKHNDECHNLIFNEFHRLIFSTTPVYVTSQLSLRNYSPLQNIKKTARKVCLSGFYSYDINSASFTLLYQKLIKSLPEFKRIYKNLDFYSTKDFNGIELIFTQKEKVRTKLCADLGVDVKFLKALLNKMLFSGNKNIFGSSLTDLISDEDITEVTNKIRDNKFLNLLQRQIRLMWFILFSIEKKREKISGIQNELFLSKKAVRRFRIYSEIEVLIRNVWLSNHSIKLDLHDGFISSENIVVRNLERLIKKETGYVVKLSKEKL